MHRQMADMMKDLKKGKKGGLGALFGMGGGMPQMPPGGLPGLPPGFGRK